MSLIELLRYLTSTCMWRVFRISISLPNTAAPIFRGVHVSSRRFIYDFFSILPRTVTIETFVLIARFPPLVDILLRAYYSSCFLSLLASYSRRNARPPQLYDDFFSIFMPKSSIGNNTTPSLLLLNNMPVGMLCLCFSLCSFNLKQPEHEARFF